MRLCVLNIVCLFYLWLALPLHADSLCDQSIVEGQKCYQQGRYEEAKTYFEYVNKRCPSQEVTNWIAKCNSAIKHKMTSQSSSDSVTYATPSLFVNGNKSHAFPYYGGSAKIIINCNKDWGFTYCYKDAGYTTRSNDFEVKREGNTLIISCASNPYTYSRSAQFNVFVRENKSIKQTIHICQNAGIHINTSANSIEFGSSGGSHKITVSTNASYWGIKNMPSWCSYEDKTSNTFTLVVQQNPSSSQRNASFIIYAGEIERTVSISQKGVNPKGEQKNEYSDFAVEQIDYYVDANGGYYNIGIYSKSYVYWSRVWTDKSWLKEEHLENGVRQFYVKKNLSSRPRLGHLYIKDNQGRTITVFVKQEGKIKMKVTTRKTQLLAPNEEKNSEVGSDEVRKSGNDAEEGGEKPTESNSTSNSFLWKISNNASLEIPNDLAYYYDNGHKKYYNKERTIWVSCESDKADLRSWHNKWFNIASNKKITYKRLSEEKNLAVISYWDGEIGNYLRAKIIDNELYYWHVQWNGTNNVADARAKSILGNFKIKFKSIVR